MLSDQSAHRGPSYGASTMLAGLPAREPNVKHWRINGYPASVKIWTAAEWENLDVRPVDAQYYPCGIWCVLRMD